LGATIVRRSLEEPLRQIVANAAKRVRGGGQGHRRWQGQQPYYGYNALTSVYEDWSRPASSTDQGDADSVADAASIAGLLLTTEALIAEIPEPKPAPGAAVTAAAWKACTRLAVQAYAPSAQRTKGLQLRLEAFCRGIHVCARNYPARTRQLWNGQNPTEAVCPSRRSVRQHCGDQTARRAWLWQTASAWGAAIRRRARARNRELRPAQSRQTRTSAKASWGMAESAVAVAVGRISAGTMNKDETALRADHGSPTDKTASTQYIGKEHSKSLGRFFNGNVQIDHLAGFLQFLYRSLLCYQNFISILEVFSNLCRVRRGPEVPRDSRPGGLRYCSCGNGSLDQAGRSTLYQTEKCFSTWAPAIVYGRLRIDENRLLALALVHSMRRPLRRLKGRLGIAMGADCAGSHHRAYRDSIFSRPGRRHRTIRCVLLLDSAAAGSSLAWHSV